MAPQNHVAVVAAAGSGKTLVLVERYLRHVLEEGVHPDRILTITFTRKAAAEMKGRIVAQLRAMTEYEDAETAETGPIQTIHSLCEQILREGALMAGIDSAFEVLSDSEASQLQLEAIDQAIAAVDAEFPEAELLIAKLAGKRSFGEPASPYSKIRSAIQATLSTLRTAGTYKEFSEGPYSSPGAFHESTMEAVLACQPDDVRAQYHELGGDDWGSRLKAAWRYSSRGTPGWIRQVPDAVDDANGDVDACGVAQLAMLAWIRLERLMEREQKFDFTALEDRALELIRSHRERYESRFDVVMVDEAQDLNPKQHQLLQILGSRRTLTVGDDRQAIYGFRLADPELFRAQYQRGALRLTKNYRSADGILDFIDHVFGSFWKEDYDPGKPPVPFDLEEVSKPEFD
jgi:ATP-dependent exoDNAse (exonuclease V) beta subunit